MNIGTANVGFVRALNRTQDITVCKDQRKNAIRVSCALAPLISEFDL